MVWALSEELLPSCCCAPGLPLAQWRPGPKGHRLRWWKKQEGLPEGFPSGPALSLAVCLLMAWCSLTPLGLRSTHTHRGLSPDRRCQGTEKSQ